MTDERWFTDEQHHADWVMSPGMNPPLHEISYTYDEASQLNEISDSFATYGYDYDNLGRATQVEQTITGLTPTVTFDREYDPLGLMTQTTATIGSTEDFVNNYVHDALGRMTQITQAEGTGNSVAEKRVDLVYDAASQLTSIDRYADVAGTSPVVASTLSYDGRWRLGQIVHTGVVTHTYAYDQADRLTGYANSLEDVVTYTYDNRNQLDTVDYLFGSQDDEDYDYDANGNRDLVTNHVDDDQDYETGADNRLASDGTYTYLYDLEGNRTARFIDDNTNSLLDAGDDDITEYEWDHRNRLTAVTQRATFGGSSTKEVDLVYDAFDRLIKRTVDADGAGGGSPETVFLVNDGNRPVLTLESDGDVIRRSLWADAVDMLLADEDASGETYFHLTNHLGSTTDIVDSDGDLVNHIVFDSYGNITSQTNPGSGYTILYAGLIWDADVALYRSFTRFYDAVIGGWTSEDPIGFAGGDANLARYVGNMATTYVDTDGLEGQWFDIDWTDQWNPFAYVGATGHAIGTRLGDSYAAWFIDEFSFEVYRRRQQHIVEELSDPGSSMSPADVACERLSILGDGLREAGDMAYRAADGPIAAVELGIEVGLTIEAGASIFARPAVGPARQLVDIHRGSGLPRNLHKLGVDVVSGRKPRLQALRDFSPDQLNQMAFFFRRQAMRARPDVPGAFEFNMARARYLEQGGACPPGNLNQFRKILNARP